MSGLSSGVQAIAAGSVHTCALTTGGGVKCWGGNYYGQLGDGTSADRWTPVDVVGLGSGVQAITVGGGHTCALTNSGGVKCWGYNYYGQLGDGTDTDRWTPVDVSGLSSDVQAIAAGGVHTCALTTEGGVKCWGYNGYGQLGDRTNTHRLTPVGVAGLSNGVQVTAAGGVHTCALMMDGGVKCWGENWFGQLGDGTTTARRTPVDVSGLSSGVQAIAMGYYHTCALTTGGGVKCWGGQLGDGTDTDRWAPMDVSGLSSGVQAIAAGMGDHTCALTIGGGVKCWRTYGSGGGTPVDVVELNSSVQAIAVGGTHTCALTTGGGVKCWLNNGSDELGDATPVDVSGLSSGVQTITAGYGHICALTVGGGVKCWGDNRFGQLGDGTIDNSWTPVDVVELSNGVQAIAAGSEHTCALTTVGGVKCWGASWDGGLGDGTNTRRLTPVDVAGLSNGVQAITAGHLHTCALTMSGEVKCWGGNESGQLGDGTATHRWTPVDVSGLSSDVQAIAAGGVHTCALMASGGVKCWGNNWYGQLGVNPGWTPVDVVAGSLAAIEVMGFVVDASNRPIPGVLVNQVDPFGGSTSSHTDAAGIFTIAANASGLYAISVAKSMYTFSPETTQVIMPPNQSGPVFIGTLKPGFAPVVFIPGIMGSHLREAETDNDLWPGQVWGINHGTLSNRPGEQRDIVAPDVIRKAVLNGLPDQTVYAPLLEHLAQSHTEYNVAGDPARRTASGCVLSQAANNPTLFVFAYDWRLSNDVNADRLADYVACIHRFYPGAKIDVVAHSMGGLIARRYILKTAPDHFVRRVITVGTPWLGAPKFLDVLETGGLGWTNILLFPNEVRRLLEAFPGAHELLPSATYSEYARTSGQPDVFTERGWDINGDGNAQQTYDYNGLVDFVNARYPRQGDCGNSTDSVCRVGDNNRTFHSVSGQDRWTDGPHDITYHYIVGLRSKADTIAGQVAALTTHCSRGGCREIQVITKKFSRGDGTVPLVSARRAPFDQSPDGSNITIRRVSSYRSQDDNGAEHLEMLHNPDVLAMITEILDGAPGAQAAALDDTIPPSEPAYYLNVLGANVGYVTDNEGKITGIVSPTLTLQEAGEVTFLPSSTQNFQAIIPTYDIYTVTFQSGDLPMLIDLVREGDDPPDYAARWRDLVMPPNTAMQLVLSPAGVQELRYDASGDGVPDTPVSTPPVVAEGAAAADIEPPTVSIAASPNRVVTILAQDPAGVMAVYYSFDGSNFAPYMAPVPAPNEATMVYAFADDNLANRSELTTAPISAVEAAAITSAPVTTAVVGQYYTYSVTATGVPTPTFSLLTSPAGMAIDSNNGLIQWTPAAVGEFAVTAQAANGIEPPAQQTFVITVSAADAPTSGQLFLPLIER